MSKRKLYVPLILLLCIAILTAGVVLLLRKQSPHVSSNNSSANQSVNSSADNAAKQSKASSTGTPTEKPSNTDTNISVEPYDDVRVIFKRAMKNISDINMPIDDKTLITLTFNEKTKWPENRMPENLTPEDLMKLAMNPGLGVKELHKMGITGKGVTVAIIDQPLYTDHPEFKDKIIAYKDFQCGAQESMHGPAVASLLAGNNIGTAPDVKIYYAAAPSWLADAKYYADALNWIIEENSKLPENNKIRVVSVSAAPSGPGSPFKKNNDLWDKSVEQAEKEGILILDCTTHHGFIGPCVLDIHAMESIENCIPGYASRHMDVPDKILAPVAPRTTAEQYSKGDYTYQYTGSGGLSWAIPYCAGVLSLGWQENPQLSGDEIVKILFDTAYKKDGNQIINPQAFIQYIKENK